jgi:eukaryotic-like serine/threonine-protein kinase
MLLFWQGRMREAAHHLILADELWSERCVGVAREQATTRMWLTPVLWSSGRVQEAHHRAHRWAKEAADRNDLFLSVGCSVSTILVWLPLDEPERVRSDIHAALVRWGRPGYDGITWHARLYEAMIELYDGAGDRAWEVTCSHWEPFLQSPLSMPPMVRLWTFSLRGLSALGAAAQSTTPEPLLRIAADCAAELATLELPEAAPWTHLLHGGIAELRGEIDAAIEHYGEAATLLEPLNPLNAAIAGARRGRLLGGDEGRALVARAHAVLSAENIKNPDRWMRIFTPAALRD